MRLNRFLAASGLGSRRSCEELIRGGTVSINGQVCLNLATDVTEADFVKVGSRRVLPEKPLYILLHKPRGYLCTVADTHERRTIFDLLPGAWPRLFHVGRLDRDSEGLIILTNDGDLSLHLTHPRFKIEKEYEVLLDRPYDAQKDTPRLLAGVKTEHGLAKADSIRQIGPSLLRIVLRQGLKRQIRLMLYKAGYEVERLIRIRIGPLRLQDMRVGEWRQLTAAEVKTLRMEAPPEAAGKAATLHAGPGRSAPVQARKKSSAGGDGGKPGRPLAARLRDARHGPSSRSGSRNRKGSAASAPKAGRRP